MISQNTDCVNYPLLTATSLEDSFSNLREMSKDINTKFIEATSKFHNRGQSLANRTKLRKDPLYSQEELKMIEDTMQSGNRLKRVSQESGNLTLSHASSLRNLALANRINNNLIKDPKTFLTSVKIPEEL